MANRKLHDYSPLLISAIAGLLGCATSEEPKVKTGMNDPPNVSRDFSDSPDELSREWRTRSLTYVTAINEFVDRGMREGWENVGEEPADTRQPFAAAVLDAIRQANMAGDTNNLHERFPRAHGPLLELLEENGQDIPLVMLLDDGRIVIRIGAPYESGRVFLIDDQTLTPLSPDIITVGRSPNREFFAVAQSSGVKIHKGWNGAETASLSWPTGSEGVPDRFEVEPIRGTPTITRMIPFDDGQRALLVSPDGIFVLSAEKPIRLLPTTEQLREHFEWLQKDYPGDSLSYDISMGHAAISPDGQLIAAGHQSSLHYVFDANEYQIVGKIGHMSEYPHYAAFSADGSVLAFNSCHFYSGETVGVPTTLLPGLTTKPYEPDDRLVVLEEGSRIYAAVARKDEFIVGNADGYLKAFDFNGNTHWQHFIGSSIGDIDISQDGKRLVASTYAGFLSILDLDTGKVDPFVIGTGTHLERRRWLFWKNEPEPLIW